MSYFPVVFKVEHIIQVRKFAEKLFGIPFLEIFRKSLNFENLHFKNRIPLLDDSAFVNSAYYVITYGITIERNMIFICKWFQMAIGMGKDGENRNKQRLI